MNKAAIKGYARGQGIGLYQEYKTDEAAKLCQVTTKVLLLARSRGELAFISTGKSYSFLGEDLIKWKLGKRIELDNTISHKTGAGIGARLGTTNNPASVSLSACAQRMLTPPSQH